MTLLRWFLNQPPHLRFALVGGGLLALVFCAGLVLVLWNSTPRARRARAVRLRDLEGDARGGGGVVLVPPGPEAEELEAIDPVLIGHEPPRLRERPPVVIPPPFLPAASTAPSVPSAASRGAPTEAQDLWPAPGSVLGKPPLREERPAKPPRRTGIVRLPDPPAPLPELPRLRPLEPTRPFPPPRRHRALRESAPQDAAAMQPPAWVQELLRSSTEAAPAPELAEAAPPAVPSEAADAGEEEEPRRGVGPVQLDDLEADLLEAEAPPRGLGPVQLDELVVPLDGADSEAEPQRAAPPQTGQVALDQGEASSVSPELGEPGAGAPQAPALPAAAALAHRAAPGDAATPARKADDPPPLVLHLQGFGEPALLVPGNTSLTLRPLVLELLLLLAHARAGQLAAQPAEEAAFCTRLFLCDALWPEELEESKLLSSLRSLKYALRTALESQGVQEEDLLQTDREGGMRLRAEVSSDLFEFLAVCARLAALPQGGDQEHAPTAPPARKAEVEQQVSELQRLYQRGFVWGEARKRWLEEARGWYATRHQQALRDAAHVLAALGDWQRAVELVTPGLIAAPRQPELVQQVLDWVHQGGSQAEQQWMARFRTQVERRHKRQALSDLAPEVADLFYEVTIRRGSARR
jgi:hypothetical protein